MVRIFESAASDSNAPFASVRPDGTIPTTNLTLPPLTSGWVLVGSVSWSAFITYSDHGRSDISPTFTGSSPTWGALSINFQGVCQVGTVSISISATIKEANTGVTETWSNTFTGVISGTNPTQGDILGRLSSIPLQIISFYESTLRQFDSTYSTSGMPVYHKDAQGGGGFGLMQLTNSPTPTIGQISDWRQNVDGGKNKYSGLQTVATNHYNNLKSANPNLPQWTSSQLQAILYQLYNTGTAVNAWYYLPNSAGTGWMKNPNTAYTAYADKCIGYDQAARNGNPPWGAGLVARIAMAGTDLAKVARQVGRFRFVRRLLLFVRLPINPFRPS
jgi:hypothetical protein